VAVKSDVKTGHDIAYVTRGHASGCGPRGAGGVMGRETVKGPKERETPLEVTVIVSSPERPDTRVGVKMN
jgi:hypothetical protein